jgi:hypothetical protein
VSGRADPLMLWIPDLSGLFSVTPMKRLTVILSAACLAATFCLTDAQAAAPKEKVLIDFTDIRRDPDNKIWRSYQYAYEDWDKGKIIDLPAKGTLIKAPSGKGGLGENGTTVRFDKLSELELVFLIGNANRAKSITFALEDGDGTEHQWSVALENRPTGRELRHRIPLAQPDSEQKPGKKPGLDLKRVRTWQVRGDYTEPNVEVLLLRLVAVPNPGS